MFLLLLLHPLLRRGQVHERSCVRAVRRACVFGLDDLPRFSCRDCFGPGESSEGRGPAGEGESLPRPRNGGGSCPERGCGGGEVEGDCVFSPSLEAGDAMRWDAMLPAVDVLDGGVPLMTQDDSLPLVGHFCFA